MSERNLKGKFYPYIVALAVSIYISTQIITLASTVNIGVTLKEVGQKQKSIFEFLINQSIENATRVSTYPGIINTSKNNKDDLMKILSFNNNLKIYDIVFFDLDGNLLTSNYEGFSSFNSLFGNTRPESILHPSVHHIRFSELYGENVIDILVPVFENGKLIAIMLQVESFERIDSAMKNVSILSTGESYIIDSAGKVLTSLKYENINEAPITIKEKNIIDSPIDGFKKNVYLDYRNENVYGYHTQLNLNRWKLIVEIDEKEVINTSSNINSFLVTSITLILATSKLLGPLYNNLVLNLKNKKTITNNTDTDIEDECINNSMICRIKLFIKSCTIYSHYRKYFYLYNFIILAIVCISIVVSIGRIKTDNDTQNNLDLSNQVNRRLISYYVNEVRGSFYALNRTITEFSSLDVNFFISSADTANSQILNIVLLDNSNNISTYTNNTNINMKYVQQAIQNNTNLYNSIGISDIFYDSSYNKYIFYLSGKIFDSKTEQWYNSIGVVSVDNLLNILLSNEMYSSKIITILNKDKILYSNKYSIGKFSEDYYNNLRNIFYNSNLYSNSVFDVNKYKNTEGIDVFGSYSSINTNDVLVYGSYSSITDTDWELLYEEPVYISKLRIYKGSIDLLIDLCYQYIQTIIQTLS